MVSHGRRGGFDADLLMRTEIEYARSPAYNGPDFPAVIEPIASQPITT